MLRNIHNILKVLFSELGPAFESTRSISIEPLSESQTGAIASSKRIGLTPKSDDPYDYHSRHYRTGFRVPGSEFLAQRVEVV